mmetsp:Transcript_23147/g.53526  ORF Transcript_23147/g.53526 Transcript_23147/m.53526 type:complete len:249 (+) Transcript_23147:382-1128(+)
MTHSASRTFWVRCAGWIARVCSADRPLRPPIWPSPPHGTPRRSLNPTSQHPLIGTRLVRRSADSGACAKWTKPRRRNQRRMRHAPSCSSHVRPSRSTRSTTTPSRLSSCACCSSTALLACKWLGATKRHRSLKRRGAMATGVAHRTQRSILRALGPLASLTPCPTRRHLRIPRRARQMRARAPRLRARSTPHFRSSRHIWRGAVSPRVWCRAARLRRTARRLRRSLGCRKRPVRGTKKPSSRQSLGKA